MFIKSRIYLDDEYVVMTRNYFLQYTQLEILEFCDTLIQHMESVKKLINERALHKREYDTRVNEIQMQTTEGKDTSNKSENDAHADNADIRPIYDEEPMAEENETLKRHYKELSDSIKTTRAKTIEHTTSLIAQNAEFRAQLQEKGFAITTLKNELRKLTGNSVNTKFAKSSILGKPVLQPLRNQSVVRQLTAFKSERPRVSKPWFTSQVDVNNDLPKPVTTHYLPKGKEYACAKPHHMIAPGSSRSQKDIVGLKWVPTGKIFTSSTTKVDSEPTNGSNKDITNQYECEQTFDVSAGTLNLSAVMTSDHNSSELRIHDHNNEPFSSNLVPKVVPLVDTTAPSKQELDLLFGPLYDELFTVVKMAILFEAISNKLSVGSYAKSWKFCQGDSSKLNLPDHRIHIKMEMEIPHSSRV
ncbi:hypothetical protein Tco_0949896 [Tanacetum coccineum]